jgi:beta-lactamase class A
VPTSTPGASPTPRPTVAPIENFGIEPLDEDADFRDALLDILGDEQDHYAFLIKDLRTGRGAQHNPEQVFYAASIFKLFVMFEVFNQQAQGRLDWGDQLTISPYYDSFGLSPRVTSLCQVLSVADAMDAMLRVSDNSAAVLLQDLVGAPNVNASITALGVKASGLFSDGLPLTAADVALLLEAIARGVAISRDASTDMLQLMTYEQIDNGLTQGLPRDTVVAHKTGNWSNATHDAGIVFAPFGPYLFIALSDTDHETRLIEALSRAAYAYFEGR